MEGVSFVELTSSTKESGGGGDKWDIEPVGESVCSEPVSFRKGRRVGGKISTPLISLRFSQCPPLRVVAIEEEGVKLPFVWLQQQYRPVLSLQGLHVGRLQALLSRHPARCQESWSRGGEASRASLAEWSALPRTAGTFGEGGSHLDGTHPLPHEGCNACARLITVPLPLLLNRADLLSR